MSLKRWVRELLLVLKVCLKFQFVPYLSVRRKPYSVVLLEEVEKDHPHVILGSLGWWVF